MGSILSTICIRANKTSERWRKHTIGDLLDEDLASLIAPYIRQTLKTYLETLQGPGGFLIDTRGALLRFDPDNAPASPRGAGVQLCFKALPQHNTRANTPVPVHGVDQFALLFCREFVKTKDLRIETADSSSLLNILTRASCFPLHVREAAGAVRDEVRNLWAHTARGTWTRQTFDRCLDVIMDLVILLPDHMILAEKIILKKQ